MAICDARGRDCIEESSSKTFDCKTTCVGIYADVEWVKKDIEMVKREENSQETMKVDLKGNIDDDLMKIYYLLKNEMKLMRDDMKLMKNEMKNDIGEVTKIATGQRGEELDKNKYKLLISEYKKFKSKNMRHFVFNSAANMSTFGKLSSMDPMGLQTIFR